MHFDTNARSTTVSAFESSLSRRRLLQVSALTAAGAAVSACTPGGSGTGGANDKPKAAPHTLPPEVAGPPYPEGYVGPKARDLKPFGDGSQTFRVVVRQDAANIGNWNTNDATKWFEQRTGVKVQFEQVLTTASDGSTDLTKINAMLASGQLPDAFLGIPFTAAQLSLYGQQGTFAALDDLIAVYAPATRDMMASYPDLRPINAATDNKLYTMPGVSDCYHCRSSNGRAWIRQSYLDKIGMDMPKTTEELRQVLLEFKGKNPSGKSGFVPFAAGVGNPLDNFFMQSFLYSPVGSATGGWLRLNDGKVQFVANLDEWRQALRYLRQLNKDGLLTPEAFSMTATELQQAGNKGLLGFVRAYWFGSFFTTVDLDKDAPWRDYVPVPPLKGPDGVQYAQWDWYFGSQPGLVITSACKKPEQLVQWCDYQLDAVSTMHLYDGLEKKNWEWAKEGEKGINGKQAIWADVQWPAPAGTSWVLNEVMYRSLDFRGGQRVDPKAPTYEASLWDASAAYEPFAEPKEMQLPPLIIPDDSAAQAADTATSISQAVQQGMSNFALGKKNIDNDADWKAYADSFTAMNLQSYLDVYQKAYDSRPK
ncbi:extracellular solute-binding protein [Microlunatus sp. Gsoil 973]|nr:extracellular solute-binding protein [Microlunatus sp. Gsoil 973]